MDPTYLALAVLVLVTVGAPLAALRVSRSPWAAAIDGLVIMTVAGLISVVLLPDALSLGGWPALLVALAGFLLPLISERFFHKAEKTTHQLFLYIAASALILHGASDGLILKYALSEASPANTVSSASLSDLNWGNIWTVAGIWLHRLSAALSLWWLLKPLAGRVASFLTLTALAASSSLGFFIPYFQDSVFLQSLGYWQALAAGSLLHIILHPLGVRHRTDTPLSVTAHRVGTTAGLAFLFAFFIAESGHPTVTSSLHSHGASAFILSAQSLAPYLVLLLVGGTSYALWSPDKAQAHNRLVDLALSGAQKANTFAVLLWLLGGLAAPYAHMLPFAAHLYGWFFSPFESSQTGMVAAWILLTASLIVQRGGRSFITGLTGRLHFHPHHTPSHSPH